MPEETPRTSQSAGRALIVGRPAFRGGPTSALNRQGYLCTEVDEPYEAMVHLCKRPLFYSDIILSLNSLYREELSIVASIRRRFSHVDIWLSDTDGRQAALAEAMRFGADGLFADEGLHRIASANHETSSSASGPHADAHARHDKDSSHQSEKSTDPILTAEELKALLQESPAPST